MMHNGLQLILSLNRYEYEQGKSIKAIFYVTNKTDKNYNLKFTSSQKVEIKVIKSDKIIWNSSHGMLFPMMTSEQQMEPGETIAFPFIWRQVDNNDMHVESGEYQIKAILKTAECSRHETEPVTIKII